MILDVGGGGHAAVITQSVTKGARLSPALRMLSAEAIKVIVLNKHFSLNKRFALFTVSSLLHIANMSRPKTNMADKHSP